MKDPKERAFIIKYIDSFNPISPSEKLMNHLGTIQVPSSKYVNVSMRKKKLTDLEFDNISYLAYSCEQCTGNMKLMAKVLYYIRWYEELLDNGDDEDIVIYEQQFRDDFKEYNIDFNEIFNGTSTRKTSIPTDTVSSEPKPTEPDSTESSVPNIPATAVPTQQGTMTFIEAKTLSNGEPCTNTHCTSPRKFGGRLTVNSDGYCENCFNHMNK